MTEMTETKKVEVPEGFMTGKFPLKKRAYGEEQPGIKAVSYTHLTLPTT